MPEPDYKIGQLIKHKLFNYRGVILKVDDSFKSTEEWYNNVAKSRPPKDKPWYTVLVHNAMHTTYVAERNLDMDDSNGEVIHPMVPIYFTTLNNGIYSKTSNWVNGEPSVNPEIGLSWMYLLSKRSSQDSLTV